MAISIRIENVTRSFGQVRAVDDVSLEIRAGEFFTLLGSSGSGKSTLLKLLGGFDAPTSGRILFDGQDMSRVAANRRPVNTVFQGLGLFPHMTVAQNVGYGLRLRRVPGPELDRKVEEALDLVELSGFGGRDVNLLSGGQRQRVALARALVMEPGILLLDEPLTGLDERLRQQMRDEFGRLHKRTGATFILVTHNQDEGLSLSNRMAVMHSGRIEQVDTPARFFEAPANAFVARFVGIDTLLRPQSVSGAGDNGVAVIAGQRLPVRLSPGAADGATVIAIRPDRLVVGPAATGSGLPTISLTVAATTFRGLHRDVQLGFADGQIMVVPLPADVAAPVVGETMAVAFKPDAAIQLSSSGLPDTA